MFYQCEILFNWRQKMGRYLKEFNKWCLAEEGKGRYFHNRDEYENAKAGWKAALKWISKLCPTNEKATFANQGQGMDSYTELANYKAMYKKLKEELNGET